MSELYDAEIKPSKDPKAGWALDSRTTDVDGSVCGDQHTQAHSRSGHARFSWCASRQNAVAPAPACDCQMGRSATPFGSSDGLSEDSKQPSKPGREAAACVVADCTYSAADGSAYCTLHGVKWGREADQADSITARSVHLVIADAARQFEREEPDRD